MAIAEDKVRPVLPRVQVLFFPEVGVDDYRFDHGKGIVKVTCFDKSRTDGESIEVAYDMGEIFKFAESRGVIGCFQNPSMAPYGEGTDDVVARKSVPPWEDEESGESGGGRREVLLEDALEYDGWCSLLEEYIEDLKRQKSGRIRVAHQERKPWPRPTLSRTISWADWGYRLYDLYQKVSG